MSAQRFMLMSNGVYSGKSTLAREMRDKHGYVLADHGLTLVREYVERQNSLGARISVAEVYEKKAQYRRALQEFGYEIGFNDKAQAGRWAYKTLQGWFDAPPNTPVIFDSVRAAEQIDYLRYWGFVLVKLILGEQERKRRAEENGIPWGEVEAAMLAHPELERGEMREPDMTLYSHEPVEFLAQRLLSYHVRMGADNVAQS